MTVKDLSLQTPLFVVTVDEIKQKFLYGIICVGRGYRLQFNSSSCVDISDIKSTVIDYLSTKYFINLDEAQAYQEELRKDLIGELFEEMSKSITKYNTAILKYFNKPLSNPFEKES